MSLEIGMEARVGIRKLEIIRICYNEATGLAVIGKE